MVGEVCYKISYKVGTEIETILKEKNCENCSYCVICDECPMCTDCQENKYYCDYCDTYTREQMVEIAERHGWITEEEAKELRENLDSNKICRVCQEFRIWQDTICRNCNPCEDCHYAYNPEYCPYSDYYGLDDIDIDKIEKYLDNYYPDESCGMEFCTKPFTSLKDYWHAVKTIVQTIGKENIDISEKCGGHINISWQNGNTSWEDYEKIIAKNILFFSDLLSYMFCSPETYHRDDYKVFPMELCYVNDDIYDKYTCVHIKNYAIEVRIPDSPKDVDNHVLFTAVLLALSFKTTEIPFAEETFYKTKEIYNKINCYGEKLNDSEKRFLADKFKMLKKFIEKPLKMLSQELGINLMKALEYRFKNPKYEEEYEKDFDLTKFAMNGKKIVNKTVNVPETTQSFMQLTLLAFA